MKELFLFSFIVIFIACQNSSRSNSIAETKSPIPSPILSIASSHTFMTCSPTTEEPLDLVKELEYPGNPGLHYREVVLKSELPSEINQAELICISDVTDSHEGDSPSESDAVANIAISSPEKIELEVDSEFDPKLDTEENPWDILTQKWIYVKEVISSQRIELSGENSICKESTFLAEEGKLFSSYFENSASKM